jgi:hypothetical protein
MAEADISTFSDIKWYKGNLILKAVYRRAIQVGIDPDNYLKIFKQQVEEKLNITNRLSAVLNNTFPPKIEELVVIASILNVTTDSLIDTSDDGE